MLNFPKPAMPHAGMQKKVYFLHISKLSCNFASVFNVCKFVMMRNLYNRVARTVGGSGLLSALLLVSLVLASCVSTSNETVTYSDTALTGFTLGTLKANRTYHVTTSSGKDSTYIIASSYSGSAYPMHINQSTNEVYNTDSLKYGTDLSKVVCTISTLNNGQVYFQSLTDPTQFVYYSSADSVDFRQERVLRVMSSDNTQTRDYKVNVNVYQVMHDSVLWAGDPINDAASRQLLATFHYMSGETTDNAMYILGQTNDGDAMLLRSGDNGETWAKMDVALPKYTSNISCADDTVMVLLEEQKQIMKIAPSGEITYTKIVSIADFPPITESYITIVGGLDGHLFAVHAEGRKIYNSYDGGVTWQAEETDATDFINNDYRMPATEVSGIVTETKENGLDRFIIVGNCVAEDELDDEYFKYASVWSKVLDYEIVAKELQDRWTYCQQTGLDVPVKLPNRENLTVTPWNGALVAFGGEARYDSQVKDYDRLYISYDSGTTWTDKDLKLPNGYEHGEGGMVMTDTGGRLIVIGNGCVWRGTK